MTMKTVVWRVFCVLILHNITKVTSQLSPWFPEQCDHSIQYKCGEICLSQWSRCYCGEEDWSWFDDREDKRYCCVPPGGSHCTKVGQGDASWQFHVSCSSGVLLPWCSLCHGTSGSSPVTSSVTSNDAKIDQFDDLQNCTTLTQTPGLKGIVTNGACKPNYKWCTEDLTISPCHSEATRLQLQLFCQNSTFWESQDCNTYSSAGTVISYGERCRGSQQHCIFPPYLNYDFETRRDFGYLPQCEDKSDQIFERHSQCNMSAGLDIWCDHCQDNRSDSMWKYWEEGYGGDCETKCGNKTKFIQEITDLDKTWKSDQHRNDVLDPHNCQASCLEPEYGCTACENKKYFNCSSSSKCLHPDLVCDGVPQCPPVPPGAEPEDEELERCKEKKGFKSDATMKCQSIFQPTVTILAVPCDSISECFENVDEKKCTDRFTKSNAPILILSPGHLFIFSYIFVI